VRCALLEETGLPDVLCADFLSALRAGRVPKTNAINIYLRALQKREPQWTERIEQVCILCLYPWYNSASAGF